MANICATACAKNAQRKRVVFTIRGMKNINLRVFSVCVCVSVVGLFWAQWRVFCEFMQPERPFGGARAQKYNSVEWKNAVL